MDRSEVVAGLPDNCSGKITAQNVRDIPNNVVMPEDFVACSGICITNPEGTQMVFSAPSQLPTDASGYLNNDGSGNLNWCAVSDCGSQLPTDASGYLNNDGCGNLNWASPLPANYCGYLNNDGSGSLSWCAISANGPWASGSGGNSAQLSSDNASGNYSVAEGINTTASGAYSHAEGQGTCALGTYSHAEGFNTFASGSWSHAEGCGSTATDGSHAAGNLAHALHSNSWIWADGGSQDFCSTTNNEFSIRAAGGVRLIAPTTVSGVTTIPNTTYNGECSAIVYDAGNFQNCGPERKYRVYTFKTDNGQKYYSQNYTEITMQDDGRFAEYGAVTGVCINCCGCGYVTNDCVSIGCGRDAILNIDCVNGGDYGTIYSANVCMSGADYVQDDVATVCEGNCDAQVCLDVSGGQITGINIITPGTGYGGCNSCANLCGGSGYGGAISYLGGSGEVSQVSIVCGGTGYCCGNCCDTWPNSGWGSGLIVDITGFSPQLGNNYNSLMWGDTPSNIDGYSVWVQDSARGYSFDYCQELPPVDPINGWVTLSDGNGGESWQYGCQPLPNVYEQPALIVDPTTNIITLGVLKVIDPAPVAGGMYFDGEGLYFSDGNCWTSLNNSQLGAMKNPA